MSYPVLFLFLSVSFILRAHADAGAGRARGAVLAAPLLALVVLQVTVPRRRSRELGAAERARDLGRLARFLALVPKEVAEGRELAAVAAVLPALGLGPRLHHPDAALVLRVPGAVAHDRRHTVHEASILSTGHRGSSVRLGVSREKGAAAVGDHSRYDVPILGGVAGSCCGC